MRTWRRVFVLAACVTGAVALADDPQPGAAPAAQPVTPGSGQPGVPPLPTLDELLGLPPAKPAEAPKAEDATRTELDRRLAGEGGEGEFAEAVALMADAAKRLGEASDTGVQTQRVQDEALRRLDKLIDEAQRQSSRSQSKSRRPQQGEQDAQAQAQQRQTSQAQAQGQTPGAQAGEGNVPRQDGAANPPRAAGGASWGNLPEHVRQALTQGQSDKFSSLYQQMTEQYYKRLAEEAGRRP